MLAGFLGKVTGEALRGLARNLLPGFWERGISANKALGELQELGLGYRRQDFLKDFREGLEGYNQATAIRKVNFGKVPSEGILEGKYFGVPDRYSMVFQVTGTDTNTNEPDERYFFYHRNSLDTIENMNNDAFDWFSSEGVNYGFEADGIRVREGYINPAWEGGD